VTDDFWTGNEQLAWHIDDNHIYDIFPEIIMYFPLHGNQSMQFGVKFPPQVSYSIYCHHVIT